MTTEAAWATGDRTDFAARFVVRAAMMAPSVADTQPWSFASSREVISVYADPAQALSQAPSPTDSNEREIVISGAAALFNLRLAMRHLGFTSHLRLLPRPGRLDHLADVRWGRYSRPTAYEERLYRAMARRRTHYGRFTVEPVAASLVDELSRLAHDEQAALHVLGGVGQVEVLAGLVRMADRAVAGTGFDGRTDGHDRRWPPATPRGRTDDHGVGVVAVLATRDDRPRDWLLAGQVLQRLLLHAAAHHISAAFHPQPLELPDYRRRIQTEFAGGAYPQLLLRLGHTGRDPDSSPRPVTAAR
jgi:hypothetical protein